MSLTRSRRALAGVADQVLSSGTNYLTAFIASVVLIPRDFGIFVVAYALITVFSAAVRAFVGEPMLAHLPTLADPARRRALAGSALGAAALLGLAGALVGLGLAAVAGGLGGGWSGEGPLGWIAVCAIWLPATLVADAGRFVLLSRSQTHRALALDATWALVQGLALVGIALRGSWSVPAVAAAWGVGALAAVAVLPLLGVGRPTGGREWLRESRYLSGWFTLISVLGQSQVYLVLLLAGALLPAGEMAGLRAIQLLIYQPTITFMAAGLVLLTPVFARASTTIDPRALQAARRTALGAMAGLGLLVLAAIPLREPLLSVLFPRYTGFAALVAPIAVQTALVALAVPFQAQLRGLRRGHTLFSTQILTTAGIVCGAALGALGGGALGLAWGMAGAAAVSTTALAVVAERSSLTPALQQAVA